MTGWIFDRACYGGVSVEDAMAHYLKTMKAAQGRNPSIKVGRADAIDLLTGESHRIDENGIGSAVTIRYRPLEIAMAIGAVVSLLMGVARPAPWLFALTLVVVLTLVWAVAIRGFLLAGASAAPQVERE